MSDTTDSIQTPENIWIITEEIAEKSTSKEVVNRSGSRSSGDIGGRLGVETQEEIIITKQEGELVIKRRKVEVTKLKQEMRGFLQAMREMLDEAETPNSKMHLDEVELSVEINGEGQVSLFGLGGGKVGGKGAMTFKFKRRS
ncbi:Pepco domain-containing protein [Brunnivagina elsteri]|uniref:Pepco domain-containing protein n=1 Tax=Brunnivagina elsteri CCALA 953 TaxID=987040 RepID=A0A2A2TIH8_9CYAN|nr:hypothetical protein [Calothrix elsteri]PAX53893.1 hypothetical protein CK510_13080 [Calothrix elsteri CCALA 953]